MKYIIKNLFITFLAFVLITDEMPGQPARRGFISRDEQRLWSITLGPVEPDIYPSTKLSSFSLNIKLVPYGSQAAGRNRH